METAQFRNLIKQLEIDASQVPDVYKKKIMMLAILGQAYTWGMFGLLIIFFLFANWVAHQVNSLLGGLLFFGILFLVMRAYLLLAFVSDPPKGRTLDEQTGAKLFKLLEKIQSKLAKPQIHQVVLDDSFRVEIRQIPRFGVFGKQRNYLLVGLPYLQSVSANQFYATLAHEFGLISEAHGKENGWIYRQRQHWLQLYPRIIETENRIDHWLSAFYRWYIPYFNACTIPFARRQVIRADRSSVRLAGANSAMHALCRSAVVEIYLEDVYWPRLMASAEHNTNPKNERPYANLPQALVQDDKEEYWKPWLKNCLAQEMPLDSPRPSLTARLAALKEKPKQIPNPTQSAADYLFGSRYEQILREFDDEWQAEIRMIWDEQHRKLKAARELVGNLAWRNTAELDRPTQLSYAEALLALGDRERGLPLALELAESREGFGEGAWLAAQALLDMKDERAMRYLEMVINQSDYLGPVAAEHAMKHFTRHGNPERANYFHKRLLELQAELAY